MEIQPRPLTDLLVEANRSRNRADGAFGRQTVAPGNPSRWQVRIPIAALVFIGFLIAADLAAFQLGFIPTVWDPFFGDGSHRVLHSFVSKLLPLPDGAVGAIGYFIELIATLAGGGERWRLHPWLVMVYGAIVAALAIAALFLTATQAFVLHAGCTLCFASAAISLIIAFSAKSEVGATVRLFRDRHE